MKLEWEKTKFPSPASARILAKKVMIPLQIFKVLPPMALQSNPKVMLSETLISIPFPNPQPQQAKFNKSQEAQHKIVVYWTLGLGKLQ